MRNLIHQLAFAVFVAATLMTLGAVALLAARGDWRAWPIVAWWVACTAAAWLVGRFTIPRSVDPEPCPQCRGAILLPTGADVSGAECCKACDGGVA